MASKEYKDKIQVTDKNYDLEYACEIATKVGDFKLSFGKFKNHTFGNIPTKDRKKYLQWLAEKSRPLTQLYAKAFLADQGDISQQLDDLITAGHVHSPFFLTFGKYRGIPLCLVELENPGYCKYLLSTDFKNSLGSDITAIMSKYIID